MAFKTLFKHIDGDTKSPNSYSGPIGKRLTNCEAKHIIEFSPIIFPNAPHIDAISHTLNTDQHYLYEISKAISKGSVSDELAKRSPGVMSHARWVTTANRILRLYVAQPNPSVNLKIVVKYIMTVYSPMVFEIKHKSSIVYGPIHLAKVLTSSKFLQPTHLRVIRASIQRNGFYAHPEHILLAMTNDDDENVRKMSWVKILRARQNESVDSPVREFKIPNINYECSDYKTLINVHSIMNFHPPALRNIEINENNIDFLASKPILEHESIGERLKNMPVHTQSVERCVKLVTEASNSVCGEKARDGWISNVLSSRNIMQKFNTKSDFSFSADFSDKLKV